MKETVNVVGAIIKRDNRIFICKRAEGDNEAIYKWEFPGGTVEKNESNEQALTRELQEEFKVNIKVNRFVKRIVKEYEKRIIDICFYEAETNDEFIMQEDHLEYRWVNKDELLNYDFAPVDKDFVNFIIAKH